MAPSDDWRPYTVPCSGEGAVKRTDGTWLPSSKAHTTPLIPTPQQAGSSADTPPAPSAAMDTSATAANDAFGFNAESYTAAGFTGVRDGPDIPSIPGPSPFRQMGHPRFAQDRGPGEGVPCAGGNPPAGCFGKEQTGENAPNVQNSCVEGRK